MTHGVASGAFGDGGLADGLLELALQGDFMKVIAGDTTGPRVWAERGGGEDVLPWPFAGGVGRCSQLGFRDVDVARTDGEVLKVFFAGFGEVVGESLLKCFGEGDDAVFAIFPIVDGDGALAEIQILDAQAHGFHEAETAAIHDLGNHFPRIFQPGENRADFFAGHHDRRATSVTSGCVVIESELLDAEDVFREENHGV